MGPKKNNSEKPKRVVSENAFGHCNWKARGNPDAEYKFNNRTRPDSVLTRRTAAQRGVVVLDDGSVTALPPPVVVVDLSESESPPPVTPAANLVVDLPSSPEDGSSESSASTEEHQGIEGETDVVDGSAWTGSVITGEPDEVPSVEVTQADGTMSPGSDDTEIQASSAPGSDRPPSAHSQLSEEGRSSSGSVQSSLTYSQTSEGGRSFPGVDPTSGDEGDVAASHAHEGINRAADAPAVAEVAAPHAHEGIHRTADAPAVAEVATPHAHEGINRAAGAPVVVDESTAAWHSFLRMFKEWGRLTKPTTGRHYCDTTPKPIPEWLRRVLEDGLDPSQVQTQCTKCKGCVCGKASTEVLHSMVDQVILREMNAFHMLDMTHAMLFWMQTRLRAFGYEPPIDFCPPVGQTATAANAPVTTGSASLDSIGPSTVVRSLPCATASSPSTRVTRSQARLNEGGDSAPVPDKPPAEGDTAWKANYACRSGDTVPAVDPRKKKKRKKADPPPPGDEHLRLRVSIRLKDPQHVERVYLGPSAYVKLGTKLANAMVELLIDQNRREEAELDAIDAMIASGAGPVISNEPVADKDIPERTLGAPDLDRILRLYVTRNPEDAVATPVYQTPNGKGKPPVAK